MKLCGHTGDLSGGEFIWDMILELQLRQPSLVENNPNVFAVCMHACEWDLWSRVGFDGSSVAVEIWVGCSVGRCVL